MSDGAGAAGGKAAGEAAAAPAVRSPGGTGPRRTLQVLGLVIVAAALLATASLVWERRERTIASAGQEMRRLSTVLAGEAARTIQGVDVLLRASGEAYMAMLAGTATSVAVDGMLRERAAGLSDVVRIH